MRSLLLKMAATAATLAAATVTATAGTSPSPTSPLGRWITASGNLEVEIGPCGQALCGTVTRVLANRSMSRDGEAMTPADTRPALGMVLLQGLVLPPDAASDGGDARYSPQWQGTIYNRENGKTYRCLMHVSTADVPQGELVLRAYVGLPILGKTQRWTRVPADAVPGTPAPAARVPAHGRPDGPPQVRDADAAAATSTLTR